MHLHMHTYDKFQIPKDNRNGPKIQWIIANDYNIESIENLNVSMCKNQFGKFLFCFLCFIAEMRTRYLLMRYF